MSNLGYHKRLIIHLQARCSCRVKATPSILHCEQSLVLSSGLLVQVKFHSTLSRLSLIMHIGISCLLGPVTSQCSSSATGSSLDTFADTFSIIAQLALGLLPLALEVLFATLLFEVLVAKQVTNGFFGAANGLVPLALSAVAVVFGRGSG